jgi:transposase
MPHDLPPWWIVHQQAMRWINAGVFAAMVDELRVLLRVAAGRHARPTAAILDSRTLQSTPESGARAGYDGAKRRKGSKVHLAVDTLGQLLALYVTPANEQDRAQVDRLAAAVQDATGESVEIAFDQGGLHRPGDRRRGRSTRHHARCGEDPRGQARLRPAAPALGRRAILRLDHPLPAARAR